MNCFLLSAVLFSLLLFKKERMLTTTYLAFRDNFPFLITYIPTKTHGTQNLVAVLFGTLCMVQQSSTWPARRSTHDASPDVSGSRPGAARNVSYTATIPQSHSSTALASLPCVTHSGRRQDGFPNIRRCVMRRWPCWPRAGLLDRA